MAEETTRTEETMTQTGEKRFTQEDVNRIVQDRLAKERSKQDPARLSLEEREKAITEKENRFACRELLTEKKMSERLLDVLDTSDPEKFKSALGTIEELYCPNQGKPFPRVVSSTPGIQWDDDPADMRKAFGLPTEQE